MTSFQPLGANMVLLHMVPKIRNIPIPMFTIFRCYMTIWCYHIPTPPRHRSERRLLQQRSKGLRQRRREAPTLGEQRQAGTVETWWNCGVTW